MPFPDQNVNPELLEKSGIWPNDYVTIVNAEKKQRAIQFEKKTWYPDIVIVNGKNEVRELCEVELEEDITPRILEKWKGFAATASIGRKGYPKFFICVPSSKEAEAKRILDESGLRYAGLRSYDVSDDLMSLKINITVTYDP